ncbi:NAD(P)H-hydrate dehydratase [Candidatus Peregrinibacteria bacterium RIFCSPLOWO2_01_FULL_39_12]|nr:MAG: NAD(P)H-hydrate dehydratase [Candidatus Peregrinibacteria bacterium RIFCSPLOWO2_01_FULL_39_12]
MLNEIKKSVARSFLPKRRPESHKGDNGRVLIVGGSIDYYGAPILSALGALYSGVDVVYLYVPECNFECTRSMYPDFIVKKYPGEFLTERYAENIIEFGKKCGSILIGPGLGEREQTMSAVTEIVKNLHIPTVLDSAAMLVLKKIEKFPLQQPIVITPHQNEFQNLVDREIHVTEEDPKSIIFLRSLSMDLHINVLLKSYVDYVSSEEGVVETNFTGNAGMTVGGTGDVLAGVAASFLAQGLDGFDAAKCAAYFTGAAGDFLNKQKGYCFSASDLAEALPYVLR